VIKNKLENLYKNEQEISIYIDYLKKLETGRNSKKELKNSWFQYKSTENLISYFVKVKELGLAIDGDTVIITNLGITLTYHAYKNLVLLKYPEAQFDLQLVKETDEFNFQKKDGKVFYTHKLNDIFSNKRIIGAYCIIKNKLGEFLETLSLEELETIRKTAKTDYIWKAWTSEMYLKTIIKKACKRHFKNITTTLDNFDNESHDIENPINIELKLKQEIEAIKTSKELKNYYLTKKDTIDNKKGFNKLISKRKKEIGGK